MAKEFLKELEKKARAEHVPIVSQTVAELMRYHIRTRGVKRILELGTAVGYSTIWLADNPTVEHITTIEIDELRHNQARANVAEANLNVEVDFILGDVNEKIKFLKGGYDFIFLDSAKGQYVRLLPDCLRLLNPGGTLFTDNVHFRGMVTGEQPVIKRFKTIVKRLQSYLEELKSNPELETLVLPIGDGVAISTKKGKADLHLERLAVIEKEEKRADIHALPKFYYDMLGDSEYQNIIASRLKKYYDIIRSLSEIYSSVHYIDLENDYFEEQHMLYEAVHQYIGTSGNASATMQFFCKAMILPEYRDRMQSFTNLKTLPERIKGKRIINAEYKSAINIDGSVTTEGIWCQCSFINGKCDENGRITHVIFAIKSIAERKRTELAQSRVLEDALAVAEQSNRSKTVFLNNMSHDIRTPMNAITGFANLALKHIDNRDKVEDYLSKIMTSSDHLLSLINDVLDMSRIESGKVHLEEMEINLLQMLEELKIIVQSDVAAKKLQFSVVADNICNEDVICDKLRINQVLLNILSNAIKFTRDKGSIELTVKQKPNTSSSYADFEFHIKDNGIGMKKEFLQHIFEPFEREKTSTVSGIQGTGLGMAITKNIVDMMGGNIRVTSEVGQGTEFIVYLRFKVSQEAALRLKDKGCFAEKKEDKKFVDFTGRKILLVEDNELNQEIAMEILSEQGFIVDMANDGDVAVAKMKASRVGQYDLILMDIQMPNMDGYEATKAIRRIENKEIANIPIIAMTANAFEEDKQEALAAGMNDHVAKPIDVLKLFELLASILNEQIYTA